MGIKLLIEVYERHVRKMREAKQALALAQSFVSIVDAQDYDRRRNKRRK
jgi:hypothetical protein